MKTRQAVLLASCFSIFAGALNFSVADDRYQHKEMGRYHYGSDRDDNDENQDKHRWRNRKKNRDHALDDSSLTPVNHPIYEGECGACHFAYQPELLPSASWMKILDQLDDHFGEEIALDPDSRKSISDYLDSNGAEKSLAKQSVRIIRSLGGYVPIRITDVPYIREKHHELSAEVLSRTSVGGLSNCAACHTTAEEGIYDDDNVRIP